MNKQVKFGVGVIALSMVVSGCSLFSNDDGLKIEGKDYTLEQVLPAEVALVMAADHSDDSQVEAWQELMAEFPETGWGKKILDSYNTEFGEQVNYETELKPIVSEDWKMLVGIELPEEMKEFTSLEELENFDAEGVNVYVAAYFAKADEVQVLMEKLLEDEFGDTLEFKEEDGVKFWTVEAEKVYIVRFDDVYVASNSSEAREEAIGRLNEGGGFELAEDAFAGNTSKENLGYMFVSGEEAFGFLGLLYKEMGMVSTAGLMEAYGDVFVTFVAEDGGLRMASALALNEGKDEWMRGIYGGDAPVLVDKVPAAGVISYTEMGGLSLMVESILDSASLAFVGVETEVAESDAVEGEDVDMVDLMENLQDPTTAQDATPEQLEEAGKKVREAYAKHLESIASTVGITKVDIENIIDSPFAMMMSEVGTLYPGISIYVKLEDDEVAAAEKMMDFVDQYMDQVLVKFDEAVGAQGVPAGLLVKGAEKSESGLRKVYFDATKLPPEMSAQLALFVSPDEMEAEFYYGVTKDGVLVLALYPGFEEVYGQGSLADDKLYKEAIGQLKGSYGSTVSYMRTDNAMVLADKYLVLVKKTGMLKAEHEEVYNTVKKFVKTFTYVVGSTSVGDAGATSDAFIGIEKVEE